jgi:hypothetical protein
VTTLTSWYGVLVQLLLLLLLAMYVTPPAAGVKLLLLLPTDQRALLAPALG